jgi:L-rhamnonate dehydratase
VRYEPGGQYFVKVIAEDGTWGLGSGDTGNTVSVIIDEALVPQVVGQDVDAIDTCNDRMWRGCLSFGLEGLTARAVAGVDLALWDLWGKVTNRSIYRLAGGNARQSMDCYVTGNDVDWGLACGFGCRPNRGLFPHSFKWTIDRAALMARNPAKRKRKLTSSSIP